MTGKNMRARKKKAKAKAIVRAAASPGGDGAGTVAKARDYLAAWALQQQRGDDEDATWKFNKTRQSFLLKSWPHRHRVDGPTFKHLLAYITTMASGAKQRTVGQARQVAASAEATEKTLTARAAARQQQQEEDDEEDEDGDAAKGEERAAIAAEEEERRALVQIQRARALRVLKVLLDEEPSSAAADA